MFQNRGQHILDDDYTPRSAVDIWGKDLGIVLETGKENKLALPLAAVAHQMFLAASAQGMGRMDDAAIFKVYAQLAGVAMTGGREEGIGIQPISQTQRRN